MLSFREYWKTNLKNLPNKVSAKRAYKKYVECEEEIMGMPQPKSMQSISFSAPIKCAPTWDVVIMDDLCCNKQEGTTPMNTNSERDYLNRRVGEINRIHDRDLAKQFHLGENTQPKTYKEMIDWIKNDKYEIDKKLAKRIDSYVDDDGVYFGTFLDAIIWTGCGFKVDREGYDTAHEALCKARRETLDVINVSDAAAGLKALQEFEAWTYEVPKSRKH